MLEVPVAVLVIYFSYQKVQLNLPHLNALNSYAWLVLDEIVGYVEVKILILFCAKKSKNNIHLVQFRYLM